MSWVTVVWAMIASAWNGEAHRASARGAATPRGRLRDEGSRGPPSCDHAHRCLSQIHHHGATRPEDERRAGAICPRARNVEKARLRFARRQSFRSGWPASYAFTATAQAFLCLEEYEKTNFVPHRTTRRVALSTKLARRDGGSHREGTAVHTGGGTTVHTNYNWDNVYWHSHKYGYWNGQHGYWHVVNGKHVFVVVN